MPKTTVSLDKETTAAIFKSIIEAVTVPVAKLTPRNSSPLAATTTTNQGSTAAPKIRETEGSTVTSTPATEFRPASEVQPPMNTTVSVQTAVAGAVGSHVASTPRTTASLDKEVLAVTSETTTKARQVPNNQVFYHSKALEKGTPKRHDSPLAAKSEDTATSTPLQVSACPASVSIDMPRHDEEIAEDEAPIEEPPPEPPPEVDKQDGISQANGMAQKREKRGPNLKLFANKREGTKNTTWRENSMWNPHIIHHPPTNLAIRFLFSSYRWEASRSRPNGEAHFQSSKRSEMAACT
ncbi:hypothetical protein TcasGA2_TC004178 [Tribolium castaneum]|uniref:Uncharacterized protein n=1 Tax=Tribolium castaneum TaxID=7070 RepID=D7GY08_TRICA|nr:hypothetical protein TcasGA2_TC004178 [Tribolium castaneum]